MASKEEEIKSLVTLFNQLTKSVKKTGDALEKSLTAKEIPKTLTEIKALEQQIKELNNETDKLKKSKSEEAKQEKKLTKERKKSAKLTDDEIKDKIVLRKSNAKRKKDLEAELILESKSIKTRIELKETLKALRLEADKLDLGSAELKKANDEIDELDAKLKDASDQFTKNKINIGNYKSATDGLTNSFEDQKKKLAILEDAYKDVIVQGKKETKQSKVLKNELKDQREAVKDLENSVKDLGDQSEDTQNQLSKLAKGTGILALIGFAFSTLQDLFGSSRSASLELGKAMANLTETISVFFKSLVASWDGVKIILLSLKESAQSFFISFEKGWLNLLISIEKGKGLFSDTNKEVATLEGRLNKLNKEQKDLADSGNTLADGYNGIIDAFKDQVETTDKAIERQQKYLQLQLDTKIQIEAQTRSLAGLAEKRQILQDISDDDTLGFVTRGLAVQKAKMAAIDFANKEEELAKLKEKLTIQAIKGELFKARAVSESALKSIQTGEQLNRLLRDKNIALKISDENEAAFTEAYVERIDKQTEALSFNRDQEEKFRKTQRDGFEQINDIIVEFGELQFAKNEEILNNEKSTQKERLKAFTDNQKLVEETYLNSTALIIEQASLSIDLNKSLSESEKETAKAKLLEIDFNKILLEQDLQKRAELIRALDLGEIEEKVLKDTFKLKTDQNNALKEQKEDLAESDRENLEINKDISLQEVALKDTTEAKLKELEEARNEQEKENLTERIESLKEGSAERLSLEKELNDKLLEEQEKLIEAKKEKEKKEQEQKLEREKELTALAFDILEEANRQRAKARQDALAKEMDALKSQQAKFEELAGKGDKNAQESIAQSQKKEEELRRKQEAEIKKQKQNEIILGGLKTFAAKTQAGDKNALGSTITDTAILLAALEGLSKFYDGTDNVGESLGAPLMSGRDGHVIRVDGSEQIWSKKDLNDTGNKTRAETKDIIKMYDSGLMNGGGVKLIEPQRFESNKELIEKYDEMIYLLQKLPSKMPRSSSSFDAFRGVLEHKEKRGNRTNLTKVSIID